MKSAIDQLTLSSFQTDGLRKEGSIVTGCSVESSSSSPRGADITVSGIMGARSRVYAQASWSMKAEHVYAARRQSCDPCVRE